MKRLNQRNLLLCLCCVQSAVTLRSLFGAVALNLVGDVRTLAFVVEAGLFLGASFIPLAVTLAPAERRRLWHGLAWLPCLFYVLVCAVNHLVRGPLGTAGYVAEALRLLGWLGLGALFVSRAVGLVGQHQKA